jgi:hypothetical protein
MAAPWTAVGVVGLVLVACQYLPAEAKLVEERTLTTGTEFSGIIASASHPGWYWAIRDVWKQEPDPSRGVAALPAGTDPDPVPSWCPAADQTTATGRNRCRQVERSSLYAIRFDTAGAVAQVRQVKVANEDWATMPWLLQDNDWEELSVGPTRVVGGTPTPTMLIDATGDGTKNPAMSFDAGTGTWVNVQCASRRMIEVTEPDPATATTWAPTRIFDLANYATNATVTSNGTTCNSEAALGVDGASPQALWIRKGNTRTIYSRSLDVATGRDPTVDAVPRPAGDPAAPAATIHGTVANVVAGPLFTGATYNGSQVVLITSSLDTSTNTTCQAWLFQQTGVTDPVALLTTTTSPQAMAIKPADVNCKSGAEGVTFQRDLSSPPALQHTFFMIRDTGSPGVLGIRVPWDTEVPAP